MARLGPSGLAQLFREIANYVSTRLSNYNTKAELGSLLDTKADDNNVIHTNGDETIEGVKTFSNRLISNKELHYKDTTYDWTDTSLNTWCDAGHVAWFDKTGNRRMHELVGAQNGVWRKACYINENEYFSVDSNRNISYWGNANFNGLTFFTQDIIYLNNNIDLTVTPSSTLYSNFIFKDKNHQIVAFLQYAKRNTDPDVLGLYINDKDKNLHGIQITSNNYLLPMGNNIWNFGSPNNVWANAYIDRVVCNRFTHSVNNGSVYITGGSEYDKGATLVLNGEESNDAGTFVISSRDKTRTLYLVGRPDGTLQWAGQNIALDGNLVHKTGNETIAGDKAFTNTIFRTADITTSTVETVYKFTDSNASPCGSIYNRMHWYNNDIYNRHHAYNATSGKDMYFEVLSANDGSGVVNTGGTVTNNKNLTTVTNATNNSYVATMGWVNNPATSTNVVHRSGNETIAGNKTFSNKVSFPSGYYLTTDTNDNSLRIIRDGSNHGNNYKIIIEGNDGKIFAPNGFKGNLQGNADTATRASYLDNYSLPNGNRIYLDWDIQKKGYVSLKVDNTVMGGLITTDNIGFQGYVTLTSLAGGNSARSLSHSVGSLVLANCHYSAFYGTKLYANVAGQQLYPCRTEIYSSYSHGFTSIVVLGNDSSLGSGTWRYLGGSDGDFNYAAGIVYGMFLRVA